MTAVITKPKQKKMSATKRNYLWDLGMGVGFLVVFNQEITGSTLHEWLGLALFVAIFTHLLLHWKWVVSITKKIVSPKLPRKTRVNYMVNMGLAFSFVLMGISGMLISQSIAPLIGFGGGSGIGESLHEAASGLTLAMVGAHLLLHLKWIWTYSKKYLLGGRLPSSLLPGKLALNPVKYRS